MKRFSALAASAAVLVTSLGGLGVASPAAAQWGSYYGGYGGGYYGGRHYRHRDRIDIGDIIGTVLVVGAVATVINQVGKIGENDRRDRDRRYDRRYDRRDRDYDDRYEGRYGDRYEDRDYAPQRNRRDDRSARGVQATEDRAADACSWAAEGQAGDGARVERINGVRADGEGWRVDGTLRQAGRSDSFTCGYTNGRVDFVQFGDKLSVR